VAAGSVLTIFTHSGFNKEAWDAFKTRTSGSLEFSVIYGHPDYGYSRRATKKCELLIFKGKKKDKDTENERDTIDIIWTLLSETDKEL
jgi:hypothetical protein